jgi:hypothetical protein
MKDESLNLIEFVSDLNDTIPAELQDEGHCFSFDTDGYEYIIKFREFALFCSANDDRDTDEDGEYLHTVQEAVRREFCTLVENMTVCAQKMTAEIRKS